MAYLNHRKSMLTASELARFLNVHINTVRRWSDRGILKAYRIGPRGDRRFSKEDIINFLNEHPEARDETQEEALSRT
ncbi:MAG TPA: helix-turn-helix domain-containing protein [Dehalococcoidia bacterium]|nr:helix-turn-helix domain-containing protein [Dehalococcoidia bacterium]